MTDALPFCLSLGNYLYAVEEWDCIFTFLFSVVYKDLSLEKHSLLNLYFNLFE
jgi:hypothetical protein